MKHPDAEPVVFGHWKHQRAYKCYTCHPAPFPKQEKSIFDHAAMDAGEYCGTCHDGKEAFHVDEADSCEVCHVE